MANEPVTATHGMVSSAHPIATQAGLDILKAGGNAFDAMIAVAATLNVVEPMMSGIGGYGTILIYDARQGRVRFLDSCGRIPAAVDSDAFRAPTPNYEENRKGPKAVATPGNVNAWEALWQEYGAAAWRDLFDSAIQAAREGFAIGELTAGMIEEFFDSFPTHAQAFYGRNGVPLAAGEILVQQDLANSLQAIAEQGAKALYGGHLGQAIDAEMRSTGGFLSMDDLLADRAEWWEPIAIDYRGCRVYTASPPATAFPSLIRLGLMSRFDGAKLGHNSAAYLHRFAEATKHAFWCRLAYAGDPEIAPPPLEKLLSDAYWDEQAEQIDPHQARPFVPPGARHGQEAHTTHFVVADRWGNLVSATQTIGAFFGSKIMPQETGIWLNASLTFCTFEPKGNPMDAHAGRRKLSGDCPTIIERDGRPWAAIGTPGGHTIGQTVPQMVMNLLDFGMDVQAAIAAPRVSFVEPDTLEIEKDIPDPVREELSRLGHNVKLAAKPLGNAHGLTVEYGADGAPASFTGGADPRGEGRAAGH